MVYGKTVDHVRSLTAVLSDGTAAAFGPLTATEHQRKLELRTREGEVYRTAAAVVEECAEEIDRRFPRIVRQVSGYNLAALVECGMRNAECGLRLRGRCRNYLRRQ